MGPLRRLPSRLFWIRAVGLIVVVMGPVFGHAPALAGELDPAVVALPDSRTSPEMVVAHIEDDDDDDDEEDSNDCN